MVLIKAVVDAPLQGDHMDVDASRDSMPRQSGDLNISENALKAFSQTNGNDMAPQAAEKDSARGPIEADIEGEGHSESGDSGTGDEAVTKVASTSDRRKTQNVNFSAWCVLDELLKWQCSGT